MRLLLLFVVFVSAHTLVRADDLKLIRTWPGYRTAESFMRVSEYFTGQENSGGQTFLRSKEGERAGYYFLVRVKNSGAERSDVTLTLQVITSKAPTPVSYSHPITVPKGQHVFQVGLTGSDWPAPEENPVAWQIVIKDAQGHTLLTDQSFLWSKPDRA